MSNFILTEPFLSIWSNVRRNDHALIRIDRFVFGSTSNSHRLSEKSKNPR